MYIPPRYIYLTLEKLRLKLVEIILKNEIYTCNNEQFLF